MSETFVFNTCVQPNMLLYMDEATEVSRTIKAQYNGYKWNGKEVSSTIRGVYGKCGFDSVFICTGHGITGIIEVYE